ncbi:unnamed protein product [Cunninghamella blakesleeana]
MKYLIHKKLINENEELKKKIKELNNEIKETGIEKENQELKKAYQFLVYLMIDWSNRVWVISEFQIAKKICKQDETPLKFIFMSIFLSMNIKYGSNKPFFSYNFNDQNEINSNINDSAFLHYTDVDDRSHASRNEDRFYALLPSWKEYQHFINNKNTISDWKIADMVSVRLKLYEILDNDDIWNKARLLYLCSFRIGKPILPSFATYCDCNLTLTEIDYVDRARKQLAAYASNFGHDKEYIDYLECYEKEHGTIFKQNLTGIQYFQQQCSLSAKANELSNYSLKYNGSLKLIYIPYFTYAIPELSDLLPIDGDLDLVLSGTLLLGNYDINRWILVQYNECEEFGKPSSCSNEDANKSKHKG